MNTQAWPNAPVAADAALSPTPVICVSHGFQTNYERGFCNGLAARGVDVTLISSDRSDHAGLNQGVRARNLRGSQEENRPRWTKALNLLRYHASLMLHALLHRGATLHVMGLLAPLFWCGVVQGLWFRLVCRRYVLTVHDVLPHDEHTAYSRRVCGWAYRLPQRVVVHTPRMKQRLVDEFGLQPQRVVVMEHGIEPGRVTTITDPPVGGVPLLLVFGIVVPRKGIDLLLEALRDIPFAFRLVIAGHGPDDAYRQRLRALLAEHPQRAQVEWRDGFVPEAEMEQLFRDAALLVLPYRYIDQSGVLFQALRFGTPVLATRVGQFEHYVSPEVGELAEPGAAAPLREALLRWSARRESLSRARIREIGRAYEWPATVLSLRDAYL